MSVKIRMARGGARNRPFFRVVIAESTSPRDGRFIERIGSYDPMLPKDHPKRLVLDLERAKFWLARGATPSERVARFLGAAGIVAMPEIRQQPKQSAPRPKTVERSKAKEEARKAAASAATAAASEAAPSAPEAEAPESPPAESPPAESPPGEEAPAAESPAGEA